MADNGDENMDVDDNDLYPIYRGKLGAPQRAEILSLLNRNVLIRGEKAFAGFVKLVYRDKPNVEAASLCTACQFVYAESSSVKASL